MHPIRTPKKLIEVALPLDAINVVVVPVKYLWARPKQKRLHKGGVGPAIRSWVGLRAIPQIETPLAGRRASDAIAGGVSARIMVTHDRAVKRTMGLENHACSE